jgi:hypothetical protein
MLINKSGVHCFGMEFVIQESSVEKLVFIVKDIVGFGILMSL